MRELGVIDGGAIRRLRDWGGPELPRKMVEIFLSHTPDRLVQIRAGVSGRNGAEVGAGAHSLKSSAGNVGAVQLQALCQAAEMMAEAKDFRALDGLLPELERIYSNSREELEGILKGMVE